MTIEKLLTVFGQLFDQQFPGQTNSRKLIEIDNKMKGFEKNHSKTFENSCMAVGVFAFSLVISFVMSFLSKSWAESQLFDLINVGLVFFVAMTVLSQTMQSLHYPRNLAVFKRDLYRGGFDHFQKSQLLFLEISYMNDSELLQSENVQTPNQLEFLIEKRAWLLAKIIKSAQSSQDYHDMTTCDPLKEEKNQLRKVVEFLSCLGLMGSYEIPFPDGNGNNTEVIRWRARLIYKKLFSKN
ncbi:MAG: hypothetical protein WC629_00425 [Candidatus Paceibacterota bacterium]|jgi:hypothetical protein